jgi:hypothetical protein
VKHGSLGAGNLRAHDIRLLLHRFLWFRQEQQLELFSARDRGVAAPPDKDAGGLFEKTPPHQVQVSLGLIKHGQPRVGLRAILVACIAWMPLLVLSAIQGVVSGDSSFASFIADYGAIGRYLFAAPVLVLAEFIAAPRLSGVARHFQDAGLIVPGEMQRFHDAIASTYRLRDFVQLEIAVFVIAFAVTAALELSVPLHYFPVWHLTGDHHSLALSAAGWWDALISTPLLVILLLGWLWRFVLWARFLWLMCRLDLRLVSAHPDGAAGLGFVGMSLQPLAVVAFALGAVVAGTVANRVLNDNVAILEFRFLVPVFAVLVVALFSAPLFVFTRKLVEASYQGVFEYDALAHSLGRQMEVRWLNRAVTPEALDANDFSATTDLYAIVSNVYSLKLVPIGLRNLIVVALGALMPFVPVVVAAVSPEVLIQKLTGMLL